MATATTAASATPMSARQASNSQMEVLRAQPTASTRALIRPMRIVRSRP